MGNRSLFQKWHLWHGCVIPCHRRYLTLGWPKLVGYVGVCGERARCVVRVEYEDGAIWVRESVESAKQVAWAGPGAVQHWADQVCERVLGEWVSDALSSEPHGRVAA